MQPIARLLPTERAVCILCGSGDSEPIGSGIDFEYETCANRFTFVECSGCGHVYLLDRPTPDALPSVYPPEYGNYRAARSRALTFRVKSWLDARGLRRLARGAPTVRAVLDVGCADGRLLDVCRAVFPLAELGGIEISEDAARAARAKGYSVRIGTIEQLPLARAAYDLVFLQQVIEHVYRPDLVCQKIASGLRSGGLLVIETPTTECLDFRWFMRRHWGGYHIPRHLNLFRERSLAELCARAGLETVEVSYTPQPVHWVWSLHHRLKDAGAPSWAYAPLHIESAAAIGAFTLVELAAWLATGHMSNLRMIARRA